MIYELWHSKAESSYMFIAKNDVYEHEMKKHLKITPDLELKWTYEAKSHFEAMQAYYDYMGWGEYKPEPGWDDTIYE